MLKQNCTAFAPFILYVNWAGILENENLRDVYLNWTVRPIWDSKTSLAVNHSSGLVSVAPVATLGDVSLKCPQPIGAKTMDDAYFMKITPWRAAGWQRGIWTSDKNNTGKYKPVLVTWFHDTSSLIQLSLFYLDVMCDNLVRGIKLKMLSSVSCIFVWFNLCIWYLLL